MVGQGGKDFFNLDFAGGVGNLEADYHIWGDWGYGPEDDPYDIYGQYGGYGVDNRRREERLEGDDDIIRIPEINPDDDDNLSNLHRFWAGDGND